MTPEEREMLGHALRICVQAHREQADKNGEPYAFHPIRVSLSNTYEIIGDLRTDRKQTVEEQCVALLHDVVEDTWVTLHDLEELGFFTPTILEAVNAITHRKGETNDEYLGRVKENIVARRVKLNDITDNLRPIRGISDEERARLREKYSHALGILRGNPYE